MSVVDAAVVVEMLLLEEPVDGKAVLSALQCGG